MKTIGLSPDHAKNESEQYPRIDQIGDHEREIDSYCDQVTHGPTL